MPVPFAPVLRLAAALALGGAAALALHAAVRPQSGLAGGPPGGLAGGPQDGALPGAAPAGVPGVPDVPDAPRLHPVTVRGPSGPPGVIVGTNPRTGAPLLANCTTCHATRAPAAATARGEELDTFHQGLVVQHGELTCVTCHDPGAYDRLRLADGTSIPHAESLRLCSQCHGPQARDWRRGSHGGMSGYWDLTRGPRERNHCLVCHDPHAPAIGQVLPAPPPNDRFLRGLSEDAGAHEHE